MIFQEVSKSFRMQVVCATTVTGISRLFSSPSSQASTASGPSNTRGWRHQLATPITSGCRGSPMITGRRPSASAWATRRWMRITLGQVALTHRTPRASRSSSTDFNSPWDLITTVSPAARPAGSSVFRTPRRARSSTTWELWIRSPSIQHPPVSSPVFAANSTARFTP